MQHLGRARAHTRALAGSEYQDGWGGGHGQTLDGEHKRLACGRETCMPEESRSLARGGSLRHMLAVAVELGSLDSNQDLKSQSLPGCHYPTPQRERTVTGDDRRGPLETVRHGGHTS